VYEYFSASEILKIITRHPSSIEKARPSTEKPMLDYWPRSAVLSLGIVVPKSDLLAPRVPLRSACL
jgi:hypothetical protein